jgi:hypothetical protein
MLRISLLTLGALIAFASSSLSSCAPATPSPTPQVIRVYATPSAETQIQELAGCAGQDPSLAIVRTADPLSADVVFRIGEPGHLTTPAFQVDTDEILVVVNKVHPFNKLTAEQVRALFTGQVTDWSGIDPNKTGAVQVWVYAPGEDVEQLFEKAALGGSPVTSTARMATSPDEMSQAIANDVNAIGVLSRHWKAGNTVEVFVAASAPVLAITPSEPQGALKDILACLQK